MHKPPLPILAAFSILAAVSPLAARGRTSTAPPADELFETVEVELVNVDVLAVDRAGRSVTDLERDDFELRVDGAVTQVDYFARPSATAAEAAPDLGAAAPQQTTSGALLALLVDLEDLRPGPRNDLLRQLRPLVAARLAAGDRVLVAVFQGTLRLASDATADAAAIDAALAGLERVAPAAMQDRLQEQELRREIELVDLGDPNAPAEATRIQAAIEGFANLETNRYGRLLRAMENLLDTLAAIGGPKTVVWIGESVPDRPAAALADRWERRLAPLVELGSRVIDVEPQAQQLRRARLAVARAAQASRSTLFVVESLDAPGAGVSAETEASNGSATGDDVRSLADLAEGSGGRSLRASPQLGESLDRVADELATRYSLGFTPTGAADERWHRIELRCRRPGVTLSHRSGFLRRGEGDSLAEAALAAASLGAPENNPLDLAVEVKAGSASAPPNTGKAGKAGKPGKAPAQTRIPVVVRVPLRRLTLVPQNEQHVGRLELQFATRDREGRLLRYDPRTLPLQIPNDKVASALRQALAYEIEMQLAPGSYRLAVAVQDRIGGVRAATAIDLVVPAAP